MDISFIIIGILGLVFLIIASFGSYLKALNDPKITKENMAFFKFTGIFYMFKYKSTRIFGIIGFIFLITALMYFNFFLRN